MSDLIGINIIPRFISKIDFSEKVIHRINNGV
jgi:hypothetical protein